MSSLREAINEKWVLVSEFKDYYEVSEFGDLRSVARVINGKRYRSRRIATRVSRNGYRMACIRVDGRPITVLIHRLIATAFVPNPSGRREVNHRDGNKLNNEISNLEWVSRSENTAHAWRLGLKDAKQHRRGEDHYGAKVTADQVRAIRNGSAETFGLSRSAIRHILSGRSWRHVTSQSN